MGILNVTPDSFSDGGRFTDPNAAIEHAVQSVADGADWIDVGGESTRPGSQRATAAEQLRRLQPVIRQLREAVPVVLSIDTTLSEVAEAALDSGFDVVNDISAGRDDPRLIPLVARRKAPIVLMHMLGQPLTMQDNPQYDDVMAEVKQFLTERIAVAEAAGVDPQAILIDPGIGFGKAMQHNLHLIRNVGSFAAMGRPMVVGVSRKGFIGRITGETRESGSVFGTAASVAWAVANGAAVVRVHDAAPMSQVVRMIRAIQTVTP